MLGIKDPVLLSAKMIAGREGHSDFLSSDFKQYLEEAQQLCINVRDKFIDSNAIAVLIQTWKLRHPNEQIYVDTEKGIFI